MNAMARKPKKPVKVDSKVEDWILAGVTKERWDRLKETGARHDFGNDQQGTRIYIFKDSPLDRANDRKAFHPAEYEALMKFKGHWYHANMAPHCRSVNMDRVDCGGAGLTGPEREEHHRRQYKLACAAIAAHPNGHKMQIVVDNVVCSEHPLHIAGFAIGYSSPHKARAGAEKLLRTAGDILSRLWG